MRIRTKVALASGASLAVIALLAAMIAWAHGEVGAAGRQREHTAGIMRALTESRLFTFEYLLYREERPRLQWHAVSNRLDHLLATGTPAGAAEAQILEGMRTRRALTPRIFAELSEPGGGAGTQATRSVVDQRFEAQLTSRLLILQQESFADAFRLDVLAAARIGRAQDREAWFSIAALALIAAIVAGAFFLFRHDVLAPLLRLREATHEIEAGRWAATLSLARDDEIGDLSRDFDAMTARLAEREQALRDNAAQLEAANRELEAFSYSVSHDLRAPLRAMDGFSVMLLEDYAGKLDEDGKDALARIRAASERMARLIDDMLELSRVTRAELNVADMDFSAAAREVADSLAKSQPGRPVRWAIEEGVRLRGDASLIRIALANLVGNAWKFTGRTAEPEIRVGARGENGAREFFVADNGAGFDMAHAGRLFGAFQRLHRADEFPGTGIGLAIVQRVIRRHGGDIRAEARPGEGATFLFNVGHPKAASHG